VAELYPDEADEPVAAVITCCYDNPEVMPARRSVFYATDDLVAGANLFGLSAKYLQMQEARILREVDAVAAVSVPLRDRFVAMGYTAELVPNGCKPEAYAEVDSAPLPADVHLTSPIAGVVGWINDRTDLTLLEAVADAGCSLLIVGPVVPGFQPERFAALTARPNVCWVGGKPFADLPSYLRLIDVGLIPYADTAFNRASFPLKTLEYLAAGRAVVSTPLPANDWLATDLIDVAAGPTEFAAAVRAALVRPRAETLASRRRAFAREHTWQRRAGVLAALVGVGSPARQLGGSW
jgi:teichuronic acid biosynthesis glycosyltransferase TuaH